VGFSICVISIDTDWIAPSTITVRQRYLVGAFQAGMGELEEMLDDEGAVGSVVTERLAIMDDNVSRNSTALRSIGVTHYGLPNRN
jgi:hypothetical protein